MNDALDRIRKKHGITADDEAKAIQKVKRDEKHAKIEESAEIVYLPDWTDYQVAAPSCMLRSALFGVVRRGRRKNLKDELLASWKGDEIRYTGERLNQSDLDIWLELLNLAKTTELGETVRFEKYGFLNSIGKTTGRTDWKWLEGVIIRMVACAVNISTGRLKYIGSLIECGYVDEDTGEYVIILNKKLSDLFNTGYTLQHKEKRQLLSRDLSKWLAGYIQSHRATKKNPHRRKLKDLHAECGSEAKEMRTFRQKFRSALQQLIDQDILLSGVIDKKDTVTFIKK